MTTINTQISFSIGILSNEPESETEQVKEDDTNGEDDKTLASELSSLSTDSSSHDLIQRTACL